MSRKLNMLLAVGLTLGLFFSAATAFASAAPVADAKPTQSHAHGNGHGGGGGNGKGGKPQVTPGAKATEKALARATEGKGRKRFTFHGTVTAAGADSLTLTSAKDGLSYTFSLTPGTMINVPAKGNTGTSADLIVGARALVQATQEAGAQTWTAVHIVVQLGSESGTEAEATTPAHVVGTVTAYTAGSSITVQGSDGGLTTYTVTAETKILPASRASLLAVGAQVTVIAAPASAGGAPTARGIVVHPAAKAGTATATPVPTPAV